MNFPLVSAICPTKNRPEFLAQAIAAFELQDYPSKELVIVDDGEDVTHLLQGGQAILYIRVAEGASIGRKRNIACQHAKGSIIVHWDDDDLYFKHRISEQVLALEESGADITGYSDMLFIEEPEKKLWLFTGDDDYAVGVSFCYRKRFWESRKFPDLNVSEDNEFIRDLPKGSLAIRNSNQIIARIHSGNTVEKRVGVQMQVENYWKEIL
jgi:glycosyltransferase involved in cell wall biosynthesis